MIRYCLIKHFSSFISIIRKNATRTTDKYSTSRRDNGILLNGIPVYSYKDYDSVRYGKLEQIKVDTQGRGYASPPFVLVDQVPNKARAVLAGEVVESKSINYNIGDRISLGADIPCGSCSKCKNFQPSY